MKQIKDVISAPLAKLTNRSFHNGAFPNILKIAKVIPIFKSESRVVCNNFPAKANFTSFQYWEDNRKINAQTSPQFSGNTELLLSCSVWFLTKYVN